MRSEDKVNIAVDNIRNITNNSKSDTESIKSLTEFWRPRLSKFEFDCVNTLCTHKSYKIEGVYVDYCGSELLFWPHEILTTTTTRVFSEETKIKSKNWKTCLFSEHPEFKYIKNDKHMTNDGFYNILGDAACSGGKSNARLTNDDFIEAVKYNNPEYAGREYIKMKSIKHMFCKDQQKERGII